MAMIYVPPLEILQSVSNLQTNKITICEK